MKVRRSARIFLRFLAIFFSFSWLMWVAICLWSALWDGGEKLYKRIRVFV